MALTKQISNRALILSRTTAEVTTAQTIAPYYDFRIDGVVGNPVAETFDFGRYIDAAQKFISAKVSVRVGGTSEYDIVVKSYDSSGGDLVEHINVTGQTFTSDNSITTLPFLQEDIGAERTLVMEITESVENTPVEDLTLTLVSSTFADLDILQPAHPVGGIMRADITASQFQSQLGTAWIEANGQSASGTEYETLTGNSVVPSLSPDADGLTVMIKVD